jgi:3-hydroxymyristoyl/3-hydroxydecanoyl-(acyl carrier protein) dehydratases
MDDKEKGFSLNGIELQKYQVNRYPLLMVDYVTDVLPGEYAKGYKNITNNEWYFPNHFPGHPNMPGCLQLEAMAQMLTIAITTLPNLEGKAMYAIKHEVRYHKEIFPGDQLILEAEVSSYKRGLCSGNCKGYTNGSLACEANMMIAVPDIFKTFMPKKRC